MPVSSSTRQRRYARSFAQAALIASFHALTPVAHAADDLSKPIHVSPDGHFLAQPDGQPFFWLADTAWGLLQRLNREETDEYLRDRAAKGFTVIQTVALSLLDGLNVPNRYGALAFNDKNPHRPNPRYFEHVDWVVDRAAQLGIRIALLPLWSSDYVGGYGKNSEKIFDAAAGESYGRWLAQRYRSKGIIWILGGDTAPLFPKDGFLKEGETTPSQVVDYRAVYDAMAKGIAAGEDDDPFITFHPVPLSFSGMARPRTSLYFHDRRWLDMNMIQSSHYRDPSHCMKLTGADFCWDSTRNYQPIAEEYSSSPTRPIVDGEPHYEDHPIDYKPDAYWTAYDSRNAAYHALFAGAAGHTYGNFAIWDFYDPKHNDTGDTLSKFKRIYWKDGLRAPGAAQMHHAKNLLLSRPYFSRIPDQELIVGDSGEGEAHIAATRDREGTYAMVYLPQGRPVNIDPSKISGSHAVGWWFDPRRGTANKLPRGIPTNRKTLFTPPTSGKDQDWVLVLDSEQSHFAAPGTLAMKPHRENP